MLSADLISFLRERNSLLRAGKYPVKDFLTSIKFIDFRCFSKESSIELRSPITAIVGRNGTGKSTVLHLAGCAFSPKTQSGKRRSRGRTFNYFVPESYRDQIALGSKYGFEYDSSREQSFVWHERQKGEEKRIGTREWDRRGRKKYRIEKDTIYYTFEKALANPFRMARFFNLSANEVAQRLDSIGKGKLTALDSQAVKWISAITGKEYSKIERRPEAISEKCYGYVVDDTYSEIACGSGELAIIRMVDSIFSASSKSLILIDEPETGVHQVAQEKLLEFMITMAKSKAHQFIFTTHSRVILRQLPSDSIVLLEQRADIVTAKHVNPSYALRELTDRVEPCARALVEDGFAKLVLDSILQIDPRARHLIEVVAEEEGWTTLIKRTFPKAYSHWVSPSTSQLPPIFILDGDADNLDLPKISKQFGSEKKVLKILREPDGYNKCVKELGKLCNVDRICLSESLDLKRLPQKRAERISSYVDHFTENLICLPGGEAPEVVVYRWLHKVLPTKDEVAKRLLYLVMPDERENFKKLFSKVLPSQDVSSRAKKAVYDLSGLSSRTGIVESVVMEWVEANRPLVDPFIEKILALVNEYLS